MTRTLSAAQWLALEKGRRMSALIRRARREARAQAELPDQRVACCSACGRAVEWRGWIHLLRQGWSWDWKRGKVVFLCPEKHEGAK